MYSNTATASRRNPTQARRRSATTRPGWARSADMILSTSPRRKKCRGFSGMMSEL